MIAAWIKDLLQRLLIFYGKRIIYRCSRNGGSGSVLLAFYLYFIEELLLWFHRRIFAGKNPDTGVIYGWKISYGMVRIKNSFQAHYRFIVMDMRFNQVFWQYITFNRSSMDTKLGAGFLRIENSFQASYRCSTNKRPLIGFVHIDVF